MAITPNRTPAAAGHADNVSKNRDLSGVFTVAAGTRYASPGAPGEPAATIADEAIDLTPKVKSR
jgi:hypothetical protein